MDNRQDRMLLLLEELFSFTLQVLQVPVLYGVKPNSRRIQLYRYSDGVGIPIYIPRGYYQKFLRYEKELKTIVVRFFPEYEAQLQQVPPILSLREKTIATKSFPFKFQNSKPFTAIIGGEPKTKIVPIIPLNDVEYAHVLVAGASGSGKTNTIQTLILSAAWNTSPEDLRILLLDRKYTGLEPLSRLPHCEVFAFEMDEIARILAQAKAELESRIQPGRKTPYLMVVIEELAEITTHPIYGKTLREEILPTLGRLGREFDVRLIVGTQKPTTEVVGSQLRQQFALRFIGRLESDRESSWLIEDSKVSAKRLPGKGLLLYKVGPAEYELIQVAKVMDLELLVDAVIEKYEHVPVIKGLLPELTPEKLEQAEVIPMAVNKLKETMEAHRAEWIKDGKLVVSLTKVCEVLGVNVKNRERRLEVKKILEGML